MFNVMKKQSNRTQPVATRVVKTSRWMHRNELKVGMYVRELDCPWENTNFMFQGFVIESLQQLHEVQEVAEYVCVASEKLVRVNIDSTSRLCAGVRG